LLQLFLKLSLVIFALSLFACKSAQKPLAPREVLKAYTVAFKKKDAAGMREFLTETSIKTAKEEAAASGKTTDEIILAESLLDQTRTEYKIRNEIIEEVSASIELQDSFGTWITVPFVKVDGEWKIAKEKIAEMFDQKIDESNRKLDEIINQGRY